MAGPIAQAVLGSLAATIAGWSSFLVIGGLVAYRCDPQALIRLAPRLTGWTRRAHRRTPDPRRWKPASELEPGDWAAENTRRADDAEPREGAREPSASDERRTASAVTGTGRPPVQYRQVMSLLPGESASGLRLTCVGGETLPIGRNTPFFILDTESDGPRRGTADQESAFRALMERVDEGSMAEADLIAEVVDRKHDEVDVWHALRAALHAGLLTRTGLARRLPSELIRLFSGPHGTRAYPPRLIEPTPAGREWLRATTLFSQQSVQSLVDADDGFVRLHFGGFEAGADLHQELSRLVEQLGRLTGAVERQDETMRTLHDLLAERKVPKTKARHALETAGKISTETIANVLAGIILGRIT